MSRLIVQTVSVKDKDGHPVEGLTVNDFTVTEDGQPQTVSFAEFQRLPAPVAAVQDAPAATTPPAAAPPSRQAVASTTTVQIATSAPGQIRYSSRRLLVLYFDLTSMGQNDQCAPTPARASS